MSVFFNGKKEDKTMKNNEIFDGEVKTKEEILQNEDEMISGLLEAANFKDNSDFQKKIEIRRNGKLLFSFFVRPLTEEEIQDCRKRATKRRPDPRGKQFGMIEVETNFIKFRSYKIMAATVDKGQGVLWSNKKLKEKLNVIEDIDVIDMVLMGGEKDQISDIIDEISGYGMNEVSLEETAKN